MEYISNAFSLQMLDSLNADIQLSEVESFPATATSVVGHPDTANVLGVSFNRVSLKLKEGDILYVAQLMGGRLPEGATQLPDGFTFKFVKVTVSYSK